ncbi:MAG: thiamine pyrophosphate-dependent enzyme [Desulfobacterales bacterium]
MDSLLNAARPPVFCPGCSHERVTRSLDRAFARLELRGEQIAIVSDIGCSGLFDTFFHTHALHGLHGRALTYATGIKLARPETTVVVTMGDGGQGIGGAHLLAACRRNLDLTLLVLNNFNFGMTGGQYSATTPPEAEVGSGFLNRLERPLDLCAVARAAGAPYVVRCSAYREDVDRVIAQAIAYRGFSLVDLWGICPGRFSRKNRLTVQEIDRRLAGLPPCEGPVPENERSEFGAHYRKLSAGRKAPAQPLTVSPRFASPGAGREEVLLLGSAGQRILTAGEIFCLAGMLAGLHVTQKSDYDITVLRGPSISEMILSPEPIDYTGIARPTVVLALGPEGVARRKALWAGLDGECLVLQAEGVETPPTRARRVTLPLKQQGFPRADWALAALGALAKSRRVIREETLRAALEARLSGAALEAACEVIRRVEPAG